MALDEYIFFKFFFTALIKIGISKLSTSLTL